MSNIFSILDEGLFEADDSTKNEQDEKKEKNDPCISSITLIDDCIASFEKSRKKQFSLGLSRKQDWKPLGAEAVFVVEVVGEEEVIGGR